jgi:hypothetical protein
MKNLVLGALLAASLTGCIISSDRTDAVITARWSFSNFATKQARSCPVGFQTAAVVSQAWDPFNNQLFGPKIVDLFNCSDGIGTTDPLDGIFLVWVQIQDDAGTQVYAQSEQSYIDTADGNATIDLDILDDAGRFFFTWDIVRAGSNALLTCADVGPGAKVGTSATLATDTRVLFADNFPCNHYYGTTDPVLAGSYTLTFQALLNNEALGRGMTLTNRSVGSPNGLTDLGRILIPIP